MLGRGRGRGGQRRGAVLGGAVGDVEQVRAGGRVDDAEHAAVAAFSPVRADEETGREAYQEGRGIVVAGRADCRSTGACGMGYLSAGGLVL
jgi:hypothetical protein